MNPGLVRTRVGEATVLLAPLSDTPRLDAELLMAHAIGTDRNGLLLHHMDAPVPNAFARLLERRLAHEPVAYIIGRRDFWTLSLYVAPGVLIPRPDSETLIEAARAHFSTAPRRILDLGTGSGALLLAALCEWPEATGLGVDASEAALRIAEANAEQTGMTKRAAFQIGDWTKGLDETFDLILCNPPYVETDAALAPQVRAYEPAGALFAGPDGLDDYKRLAPQIGPRLNRGGVAVVEIGYTQAQAVAEMFAAHGLLVAVRQDLGGRDRCLILTQ